MKQMTTMRHKLQHGFSLITAIFLLVVLASLGMVMMTFFTTQQQSLTLDVMGSRAYQASHAGIEWAAFQITQSSVAGGGVAAACQGGAPLPLQPAFPALSAFSVSVSCSASAYVDGINGWIYQVSSVAATQGLAAGNQNYVERQLSVTIVQ